LVQRITVTVPDELHERLQKVKESINVSGVCQEAIESAVYIEELKLKGQENMDALIERLKAEKQEFVKQYEEQGYKDGIKEIKDFSYSQMKALSNFTEEFVDNWGNTDLDQIAFDNIDRLGDEQGVTYIDSEWIKQQERNDSAFDRDIYTVGWVRGAVEFIDEIEGKL
jgi:post-segregation antitoxin (ccd killing protein)